MKTKNYSKSSNSSHQIILVSILSIALLTGLICGSLIISKSIRDAHRFQYADPSEGRPTVFDSYTGYVIEGAWVPGLGLEWSYGKNGKDKIRYPYDWVEYKAMNADEDF